MNGVREFLASKGGRVAAAAAIVAMSAVIYASSREYFSEADFAGDSRTRTFICAETGRPFKHTLTIGDEFPLLSPHSDKHTGYPAELCYWSADGGVNVKPTHVLLNPLRGQRGPTFCPDCDRLVTEMNEPPRAGIAAPPTRAEHAAKAKGRRATVQDVSKGEEDDG
jgi:hypothetical protein